MRLKLPINKKVLLLITTYENTAMIFTTILLYTIISVIWFFVVKPLFMLVMKLNIKLIKKDGRLPYGKDVLIQFNEDYFIENTNETESKVKYEIIEKIVCGMYAIYIYISSIQAFIVPFSVFENEEQRNEFLEFVNNKVGKTENHT